MQSTVCKLRAYFIILRKQLSWIKLPYYSLSPLLTLEQTNAQSKAVIKWGINTSWLVKSVRIPIYSKFSYTEWSLSNIDCSEDDGCCVILWGTEWDFVLLSSPSFKYAMKGVERVGILRERDNLRITKRLRLSKATELSNSNFSRLWCSSKWWLPTSHVIFQVGTAQSRKPVSTSHCSCWHFMVVVYQEDIVVIYPFAPHMWYSQSYIHLNCYHSWTICNKLYVPRSALETLRI